MRYVVGMLCGWALFAVGFGYVTGEGLAVGGYVGFAAAVASMPVSFGGWVFVWGDGPGQPPAWATTMWFSVLLGLVLYGALGALAAAVWSRFRRWRGDATSSAS
ncbi:MAG: hypothetical protein IT424_06135 [Pirellulales bacterium]|nr:hypothetical protein [Pirellulales bacterium]